MRVGVGKPSLRHIHTLHAERETCPCLGRRFTEGSVWTFSTPPGYPSQDKEGLRPELQRREGPPCRRPRARLGVAPLRDGNGMDALGEGGGRLGVLGASVGVASLRNGAPMGWTGRVTES